MEMIIYCVFEFCVNVHCVCGVYLGVCSVYECVFVVDFMLSKSVTLLSSLLTVLILK